MYLRNKKTGEIIELLAKPSFVKRNDDYLQSEINTFNSLAELNEEWEDHEESKDIWWLDNEGNVNHATSEVDDNFEKNREIGNYFGTREEAEKAVERLRAWKRLKDNGFKFEGLEKKGHYINFYQGKSYETDKQCQQAMSDLELLFGDEG